MPADQELSNKLNRRQQINDQLDEGQEVPRQMKVFNPYTAFPNFSRKNIREYEEMFKKYDTGNDGYIDFHELKIMMEKLGAPQTHLGLKEMIREVDEDNDGKICFREFILIFHKVKEGEILEDSGLAQLAKLAEIAVEEVGVGGAKSFFEAKIHEISKQSKFEEEIRKEQEDKKRELEEKKERRQAFQEKAKKFNHISA